MNLSLVKQENFGSVLCDFWENENGDIFMTREQIGKALEYSNPRVAITKIHARYKHRLDKFSVSTKLVSTDGKSYETVVYNAKGIYEICRHSEQPKADVFYDWVYDLLENLRKWKLVVAQPQSEDDKLKIQKMRAEAMLRNARTRQAKLILDMKKDKTLSPVAVELLEVNALEVLTGQKIEYRPEIEKTYTASEIAEELGITPNKVGRIANAHGLKTAKYGIEVLDKSPHCDKQVSSFRYNEEGRKRIHEILNGTAI